MTIYSFEIGSDDDPITLDDCEIVEAIPQASLVVPLDELPEDFILFHVDEAYYHVDAETWYFVVN